jgi:hypothetical protein
MQVKNPTHLANGERVTLDGVPGKDDHLGLHAFQMGAFVFDNPVVVLRERLVATYRDNRVGRYSRRDRDRRQSLDKRVAGGHIVDTARQAGEGQLHCPRVARDQILHDIDETLRKARKASDLMAIQLPAS